MGKPKGWSNTVNIGTVLELDNVSFVVFKTPISRTDWDCYDILDCCPDLIYKNAMILNISSTKDESLLYNKSEFTDDDIEHKSFFLRSRKRVTPDFVVAQFFDIVDDFIEASPKGIIGIHAIWSIEKTSHLIGRYLIEKKGWLPEEALAKVDTTRKEKMVKDIFIRDLTECSDVWETEVFQHCVVVEFDDPSKVLINLMDTLIVGVFTHEAIKENYIPITHNDLDMNKTSWLNDSCVRVWFVKRSTKHQIQKVLDENEFEIIGNNFKIQR